MNAIDKAMVFACIKNAELRLLNELEYWGVEDGLAQQTLTYISGIKDMAIAAMEELDGETNE